jgi:hypothetical protein
LRLFHTVSPRCWVNSVGLQAMPTQRYVSPELTHFVGRGLSEDQQYALLVNDILKAGWLMHPPIDGRQPA